MKRHGLSVLSLGAGQWSASGHRGAVRWIGGRSCEADEGPSWGTTAAPVVFPGAGNCVRKTGRGPVDRRPLL